MCKNATVQHKSNSRTVLTDIMDYKSRKDLKTRVVVLVLVLVVVLVLVLVLDTKLFLKTKYAYGK